MSKRKLFMLFFLLIVSASSAFAFADLIEDDIGDYEYVATFNPEKVDNLFPTYQLTYEAGREYFYLDIMDLSGESSNHESGDDYFNSLIALKINESKALLIGTNYIFRYDFRSPVSGNILKYVIWRSNNYYVRIRVYDYADLPTAIIESYLGLYPSSCFQDACPNLNISVQKLYERYFLGYYKYTSGLTIDSPLTGFLKNCYDRLYPKLAEDGLKLCDNVNLIILENSVYFDRLKEVRGEDVINQIIDFNAQKELERKERIKESCLLGETNDEASAECNAQPENPEDGSDVAAQSGLEPCTDESLANGIECYAVQGGVADEVSGEVLEKQALIQEIIEAREVTENIERPGGKRDRSIVEEKVEEEPEVMEGPQAGIEKITMQEGRSKESLFSKIIALFKNLFS